MEVKNLGFLPHDRQKFGFFTRSCFFRIRIQKRGWSFFKSQKDIESCAKIYFFIEKAKKAKKRSKIE